VTSVFWSFSQPIRQALIPSVVPRRDLMNAIALNAVGFNATKVLGPALGGLLIAWVGAGGNFLLQAAAYGVVWAMLLSMQIPPNVTARAKEASAWGNLKEGLVYVRRDPLVLALITAALVPQVLAIPYQALLPVFQKDVLGLGPEVLGLMLAAPGIGAMLSTASLATFGNRVRRKGLIMLGALVGLGLGLVLFASTTVLGVGLAALVVVGGCQVLFNATTQTMIQVAVPDHLRGRVMSIYMLDVGLRPAGSLAAGVATAFLGAPLTVSIMGCLVILLVAVLAWRAPQLRTVEA
jgi:predicted MFS family arabinose efflux permease